MKNFELLRISIQSRVSMLTCWPIRALLLLESIFVCITHNALKVGWVSNESVIVMRYFHVYVLNIKLTFYSHKHNLSLHIHKLLCRMLEMTVLDIIMSVISKTSPAPWEGCVFWRLCETRQDEVRQEKRKLNTIRVRVVVHNAKIKVWKSVCCSGEAFYALSGTRHSCS